MPETINNKNVKACIVGLYADPEGCLILEEIGFSTIIRFHLMQI